MTTATRPASIILKRLARLATPHAWLLAAALALLVVTVLIEALVLPALFACLLVAVVGPGALAAQADTIAVLGVNVTALIEGALGTTSRSGQLLALAGAGVAAMLLKSLCLAARGILSYRFSFEVARDLRAQAVERLLGQSADYFEDARSGALLSRLTGDISLVQQGLGPPLVEVVQAPLTIATALVLLVSVSWQLTLATLCLAPAVIIFISKAGALIKTRTEARQQRLADLNGYLAERLAAVRFIQLFGRERDELRELQALDRSFFRDALRSVRVAEMMSPATESVVAIGMLAGLVIGGMSVLGGSMTREHFILFFAIAPSATTQLGRLARVGEVLQQISGAATSVFGLLDGNPSVVDAREAKALPTPAGRVRFEHVSFAYRDGRSVLNDVDVEVPAGSTLAIVGPSGAGKTTLVNLLPRVFDPSSGRVLIDGHDVRSVTLASLRACIGMVSQDAVLFSHTVADNIRYGKPEATDAEVKAVADAAHATEFIEQLPAGWMTMVGERGSMLSGGQRQRLAIARALLRDPKLLILDEATSALDTVSEQLVQDAIDRLVTGRTTLVIAHRLSTVRRADRILVLDEGRAVELGTHDELMTRSGLYRRLYEAQFRA